MNFNSNTIGIFAGIETDWLGTYKCRNFPKLAERYKTIFKTNFIMRFSLLVACIFFCSAQLLSQHFEQVSYPVYMDGEEIANPFAGGLNNPQFSLGDISRNGENELVVFDRDGAVVLVFENFGSSGEPDYRYNAELSRIFPEMRNFMLIRDYNHNGIPDIFTYSNIGVPGIQVYTGSVVNGQLSFDLLQLDQDYNFNVLAFRDGGGMANINVLNIDLPAIVDVDGDGDLDIIVFTDAGGTAQYFRNRTVEEGRQPHEFVFRKEDRCWGKFYENDFSDEIYLSNDPNQCASFPGANGGSTERHAGSTIALFDETGNGLYDALIGDLTSNRIAFLKNGGTPANAWMTEVDVNFPSYDVPVSLPSFNAPFILDVDGDGKDDLIVSPNGSGGFGETQKCAWFYRNVGTEGDHHFEFVRDDFIVGDMIDLGSKTVVAVADVDGDGLPDIVVGNYGLYVNAQETLASLYYFRNIGTAENPAFELVDEDLFGMSEFASSTRAFAPVFYDMTGNGALDVIVGDQQGRLFYGENQAGPGQPIQIDQWVYPWMDIDVGQWAVPAVADINGNGLPDLVVGERTGNNVDNARCGNLNYFENTGTREEPFFHADEFEAPNNPCFGKVLTFAPGFLRGYSAPSFYETDGEPLMVVGSFNLGLSLYQGLDPSFGVEFEPLEDDFGGIRQGHRTQAVLADLNHDGILEAVVANQRGGLAIFKTNINSDGVVSTKELPPENTSFDLFPNPAKAEFTIRLPEDLVSGAAKVEMFDLSGRSVAVFTQNGSEETFSVRHIQSGTYIVRVTTSGGYHYSRLLVLDQ